MSDHVLRVVCASPQDALDAVAALPGVRDVALFGRDLHVVTADSEALAPRLLTALPAAGFAVEAVERVTPSLEDVFVSLIEAKDREEGAQREFRQ